MSNDLIVVCSACKRLRISPYTWIKIDVPLANLITHGLCPECIRKLYPEMADEILKKLREIEKNKNSLKEKLQWNHPTKNENPK